MFVGEDRGEAGGARAFGHRLLDGDEQAQRVLDLLFAHEHDVIDQRVHDLASDAARCLDRDALGERVAAHRKLRLLEEVVHRRIKRGLHADDLK